MRVIRRKRCRECKVEKVVSRCNFYRTSARNRDGYMNVCKVCHDAYMREIRELKREQYKAMAKRYNARPDQRARRAAYAKTPRGQEVQRAAWRRWKRFKALESRA
ncbi:MAG: hypothetical protein IRZ07_00650 [Microbispora sp.]|nr:hypothetical protein [Microbispora sp.]